MVGIVLVSHSKKLVEGVSDLINMMAPDIIMACAGGKENGEYGTSPSLIKQAIEEVYTDEGVVVFLDLGSAILSAEKVVGDFPEGKVILMDCPIVEGAVASAVVASGGASLEEVIHIAHTTRNEIKF